MKPSHYLLLTFVAFGVALWATDRWPFRAEEQGREPAPVVVKRTDSPGPRPTAGVVRGRVLDRLGWPIAGATVRTGQDGTEVKTGADGRFRLQVTGAAPVEVVVEAESYRPVRRRLFPALGDAVSVQMEPAAPWDGPEALRDPAGLGRRAGQGFVQDDSGAPLAGALVTVAETGSCARTDEIGRYIVALPDGPATLVVHAPDAGREGRGLAARSEVVQPVRREGLVPLPDLRASPATSMRGTVLDPEGNPVAGAPVVVRGHGLLRYLETDAQGAFSLAGLLTGRFELIGLAYRGQLGFADGIELGPAGLDMDFHLRSAQTRRVRVVDSQDRIVPAVHVAVADGDRRRSLTRADSEGWAELRGLTREAAIEVRRGEERLEVLAARPDEGRLVVALP